MAVVSIIPINAAKYLEVQGPLDPLSERHQLADGSLRR
jgi:hypothetical protein